MDSIVEAVFQHAELQPARPAIVYDDQVISYGQLAFEVERFAHALAAWGLQPGDRVALFLENSPAFVVAYLGTNRACGIVVLVNTQYRQVELTHILTDAGVRLCVTSALGAEALQSLPLPTLETLVIEGPMSDVPPGGPLEQIPFVTFAALADALPPRPLALPAPDAPAVLGYTSGTTGRAKGALLLHRNLTANITALTAAWRWTGQDRLWLSLPLFHAHGLMVGLHGTLFTGASAVCGAPLMRRRYSRPCARIPDHALFRRAHNVCPARGRSRTAGGVRTSATPVCLWLGTAESPALCRLRTPLWPAHSGALRHDRNDHESTNPYEGERRAGTVGAPFPGQEARIMEVRTRQQQPPGEIGEIEVRGPHVFAGYWNRPEATAEAFSAEGWFKTGDLGWCSADGYYTITGRARELIISGGYNVYPREVEEVLETHPSIAEVAVVGLPDADLGEQVVAVVVPREGDTPSAEDIIAFCRERLASFKKPRQVVFVEALPRNALGKVQKHVLTEQLQAS